MFVLTVLEKIKETILTFSEGSIAELQKDGKFSRRES